MLFNFWRRYPRRKPKKDGWYQCSIHQGDDNRSYCVTDLYFNVREVQWYDPRRQNVFDGYKVYKACRAPIDDNRVYTDSLCLRDDVVAWKHLPKVFGKKEEKNDICNQ